MQNQLHNKNTQILVTFGLELESNPQHQIQYKSVEQFRTARQVSCITHSLHEQIRYKEKMMCDPKLKFIVN